MIGTCIFMTANEHLKYDVDGLTHTKQLLNLLGIVYITHAIMHRCHILWAILHMDYIL